MRAWLAATGTVVAVAAVVLTCVSESRAGIDAVRGRQYQITKRHGPWMIKVATFHAPPDFVKKNSEGLTPKQAADELVYELRIHGIPAYAFQQKDSFEVVNSTGRTGRGRFTRKRRSLTAFHGGIAVLAGNYSGVGDKLAQATLKYVKKFIPKFLSDVEGRKKAADGTEFLRLRSGGLYRSTPGRPTPFAGAHLTPNPLLSSVELHSRKKDPLLLLLNSGTDISLLNNKGKYTLVVASFYGKSLTVTKGNYRRKASTFKVGKSLDLAGKNSWELTVALRRYRKMEAWVYHDHYKSIVTVGSFNSSRDPRIKRLHKLFRSKYRKVTQPGHPQYGGKVLTIEWMTIPLKLRPGQIPERKWLFDIKPRLMMVPKISG